MWRLVAAILLLLAGIARAVRLVAAGDQRGCTTPSPSLTFWRLYRFSAAGVREVVWYPLAGRIMIDWIILRSLPLVPDGPRDLARDGVQ